MPLSVGDKLDHYEVLAPLGSGGMGEVYCARDSRLGRDVALKILPPHMSGDADRRTRFIREAQSAARLNHANIVTVYEIGEREGRIYLVMEYVDGKTLADMIPATGLPAADVLDYAVAIAAALAKAHGAGVIHRDLKPGNIMITSEGVVKVLDFGLAKLFEQTSPEDETLTLKPETQSGVVMGTPAFMSPEQAEGKIVDARSDIFSFGSLLYEMTTGKRAFGTGSLAATFAAVLHKEPESFPGHIPRELCGIILRCLRKDPADRFQAMAEVKTALEQGAILPAEDQRSVSSRRSIAVLPFVNMTGDKENDYLSDGFAEEIINFLAQIPDLRVTARTSAFAFRGKEQDIRKIAALLGVATILEGSVRLWSDRIRVVAQLIDASDGCHVWSQRYDREMADLFDLQDEIAQAIATALQVKLSGATPAFERYRPSLPAYEALMKARHLVGLFRPELFPRMKEYFEQAIALDPQFALAYSEYGNYFFVMAFGGALPAKQAMPRMRALAQQALELDPSISEAHALLGGVAALLEYNWKEAERQFGVAMARQPVSLNIRQWVAGGYFLCSGRSAEALEQVELMLQEDPLNVLWRAMRSAALAGLRRDEEAAQEYRKILEFDPAMAPAHIHLAGYYAHRGRLDEALAHSEKAFNLSPLPHAVGLFAGLLKRSGDVGRAETVLAKLQPDDAFGVPRGLAIYHWALREFEAAADWFEKGIDQRDPWGSLYIWSWYGRELRSTPRWPTLMRKVNLPEA